MGRQGTSYAYAEAPRFHLDITTQSSYEDRCQRRLRAPGRHRLLVLVACMLLGAALGAGSVVLDATGSRSAISRRRAQQILFDGNVDAVWLRAGIGLAIGAAIGLLNVCFGREHHRGVRDATDR